MPNRFHLPSSFNDWLLSIFVGLLGAIFIGLFFLLIEVGDFRFLWFTSGAKDVMEIHFWVLVLIVTFCLGILTSRLGTTISVLLCLTIPVGRFIAEIVWGRYVSELSVSWRTAFTAAFHPASYFMMVFGFGALSIGKSVRTFKQTIRTRSLHPELPSSVAKPVEHPETAIGFPSGAWPTWNWPDSGWWLTACGTMLGIFVSLCTPHVAFEKRVWIVIGSCAAPALILVAIHVTKVFHAVWLRCANYGPLFDHESRQRVSLSRAGQILTNLMEELRTSRQFKIKSVSYYRDTLYVTLKKKRGVRLDIGSELEVIDLEDGFLLGRFQVVEILDQGYYASGTDSISPVWRGYAAGKGNVDIPAPPHAVAILIKEGEENDTTAD